MRKLFLLFALVTLFAGTTLAENKFGYMNSMEIISLMPEAQAADSAIQKYAVELDGLINKMYTEYDAKAADASSKKQKGLLTPEQEELIVKDLQDLEKRITDFQEAADAKIDKKRQALFDPILKKLNYVIATVAKNNGYTYIFDTSSQALLYAIESDYVLPLVKNALNIKDTPAHKTRTTPK